MNPGGLSMAEQKEGERARRDTERQNAGYDEAAREVQRLWVEGKRDEAAARVPEEMILKSNLLGTEAMVKERICIYRDAGITTLRVLADGRTLQERVDTLGRVIDLVRQVSAEAVATAAGR